MRPFCYTSLVLSLSWSLIYYNIFRAGAKLAPFLVKSAVARTRLFLFKHRLRPLRKLAAFPLN